MNRAEKRPEGNGGERGEKGNVDWKKYAAVTVIVFLSIFGFWVLLRYGMRVLLPFLLAWLLSLILAPVSEAVARRTGIPRGLAGAATLILSIGLLLLLSWVAAWRFSRELGELFALLGAESGGIDGIIQRVVDIFSGIESKIPFLSSLSDSEALAGLQIDLEEITGGLLRDALSSLSTAISGILLRIVRATPSALLFLLVFLVSSFYFLLDGDRIYAGIRGLLPQPIAERTRGLRRRATALLYRYLRVYLLLFVITLLELLVGLLLLGRDYALLLALVIAALDILPVLGVGTVLLPWSLALFVMRDFYGAIGLLVLWGVILVVRQILEPRLFGDSFGIHPLFALVALYAGLSLFGVPGLLIGPAVAVFLKLLYTEFLGRGRPFRAEKNGMEKGGKS